MHTIKQSNTLKNHISLYSITLLGILFFTVWTILYALIVFRQFTWVQIVTVSLVFNIILYLFTLYFTDFFKNKIELTLKNIVYAFILFLLMWYLSISNLSDITISKFVHTYPLLETELGLGWDEDTVYHVSIIQSILHFGYPSIAQHGVPFNIYHALSHYVDAFIIYIAQIEPYDSYALLFTFKVWLFIVSISIFIYVVAKKIHPLWYLFIFIVVAPIFIGSWRAMSSHPLWFTTILILFSSLKIFKILLEDKLHSKNLFFIFFIIIMISLGKISSGLMEASLIGFFIFMKYPKDKRVYFLGLGWSLFFIFYITLFSESYGLNTSVAYNLSKFSIKYFYEITWDIFSIWHVMISSSLLILVLVFYLFNNKNTYIMLFSAIFSSFILIFIIEVKSDLANVDRLYFYFGFTYILNLITFQFLMYEIQKNKILAECKKFKDILIVAIMAASLYVSSYYVSSNLSFSPYRIENNLNVINTQAFSKINERLNNENKISLKRRLFKKTNNDFFHNYNRPLSTLRDRINTSLKQRNIPKNKALLFIPKEIYMNSISKFYGPEWARGMLMYATLGIPLIYGIKDNRKQAYNQQEYTKKALWKQNNLFTFENVCQDYPLKTIIRLVDFENLEYEIHNCK